jgi:argininosuccinate lyase
MKLWAGRFEKGTAAEVDDFHSSIHFDWRMYRQDIQGSIAHARMLGQAGHYFRRGSRTHLHHT